MTVCVCIERASGMLVMRDLMMMMMMMMIQESVRRLEICVLRPD